MKMKLEFDASSENERLARTVAAAFILRRDPTLEEMNEVKTAVSEAVTNAVVHGYRDGKGTVTMCADMEGDIVEFEISDNGVGIEDIKKAREPLYTTAPENERSGMGFTIMEAFMDEIEVKSKPGKGTAVIMRKKIGACADVRQ